MIIASVRGGMFVDGKSVQSNDIPFSITVRGHAFYSKKGSDVVCAAVSVLVQAFIRSLVAEGINLEIGSDQDMMTVGLKEVLNSEMKKGLGGSVDMLLQGLVMTAESYPDHLKIEFDQMR